MAPVRNILDNTSYTLTHTGRFLKVHCYRRSGCSPPQKEIYKRIKSSGRSGDLIPVEARFFAHVQAGLEAHPASCTMGSESSPGVKRPGRGADHPPLLAPRSRKSTAIPLLPVWAFEACYRASFTFLKSSIRDCSRH
jgi:hypothetical protein